MNALTALKLAIESWSGISGYDDRAGDTQIGLYAELYKGPFIASEILEVLGEARPLDSAEELAPVVGAIFTVDDIGQKELRVYADRRDLMHDWHGYQDELEPMNYAISSGDRVTVYSGSGRSVAFLQDEDGSRLADELAACKTEEETQTILDSYRPC